MSETVVDVVGVFDEDFAQVFVDARAMKADITRTSRVMRHPLENGSSIADHRVIDPDEIALLLFMPDDKYRDLYAQIATAFATAQKFTIQTKVASFPDMFISEMPHEETPEFDDLVQIIVKFTEVKFLTMQFEAIAPARPASKATVKRGEQAPKADPPTAKKSSVAYSWFNK